VAVIKTWQLQEAKNKLSQVVDDAVNSGPQIITKRGTEVAIVLSYASYQKMVASRGRLSEFFRESPLVEVEMDLNRDKSAAREDLEL
jgi:prevent-host-death family protein